MREILIELLQLAATTGAVIVTRWLLELSTPAQDWREVKHWFYETFQPERFKYYQFPEVTHQLRAWAIFRTQESEEPSHHGNQTRTRSTTEGNRSGGTADSTSSGAEMDGRENEA